MRRTASSARVSRLSFSCDYVGSHQLEDAVKGNSMQIKTVDPDI